MKKCFRKKDQTIKQVLCSFLFISFLLNLVVVQSYCKKQWQDEKKIEVKYKNEDKSGDTENGKKVGERKKTRANLMKVKN